MSLRTSRNAGSNNDNNSSTPDIPVYALVNGRWLSPLLSRSLSGSLSLDCQHFFHTGCLRQFLNNCAGAEPLCPICRAPIPWHPSSGIKPGRVATTTTTPTSTNNTPNNNSNNTSNSSSNGSSTSTSNHTGPHNGLSSRPGLAAERTLAFGSGAMGPPTPDSFSRAARGADAAVRLLRRAVGAVRTAQTFRTNFDAAVVDAVPPPAGSGPTADNARGEPGRAPRPTIVDVDGGEDDDCLLYTSPSPRD